MTWMNLWPVVRKSAAWLLNAGEDVAAARAPDPDPDVTADRASARSFAAPGVAVTRWDRLVDNANRAVRPVVSGYVFGGLAGAWPLADLSAIDPRWLAVGATILGFWFGGRLLARDIPAGIVAVLSAWSKRG